MAPPPHTKDYYAILQVDQNATLEDITRSYRKLALKFHPDRSFQQDTKEAFQELSSAYEVLKDEEKRASYDHIYPSIKKQSQSPDPATAQSSPNNESTSNTNTSDKDEVLLQKLRKAKEDHLAQWCTRKATLEAQIAKLPRTINRLQADIVELNEILSEYEAYHRSTLYKKFMALQESEKQKAQKESNFDKMRANHLQKQRTLEETGIKLRHFKKDLAQAESEFIRVDEHGDAEMEKLELEILRKKASERREFWKQRRKVQEDEAILKQQQEDAEEEVRRHGKASKRRQENASRQRQQRDEGDSEQQWSALLEACGTKKNLAMGLTGIYAWTRLMVTPLPHSGCDEGGKWKAERSSDTRRCRECPRMYRNYLHCTGCGKHRCLWCDQCFEPRKSW